MWRPYHTRHIITIYTLSGCDGHTLPDTPLQYTQSVDVMTTPHQIHHYNICDGHTLPDTPLQYHKWMWELHLTRYNIHYTINGCEGHTVPDTSLQYTRHTHKYILHINTHPQHVRTHPPNTHTHTYIHHTTHLFSQVTCGIRPTVRLPGSWTSGKIWPLTRWWEPLMTTSYHYGCGFHPRPLTSSRSHLICCYFPWPTRTRCTAEGTGSQSASGVSGKVSNSGSDRHGRGLGGTWQESWWGCSGCRHEVLNHLVN